MEQPALQILPAVQILAEAATRLGRASVLVVGDAMLDRYIYGDVDSISPEAPVPVLCIQRELAVPGGAANVVRNLGALGAAVAFVSVVGDDQAGSDLTGLIGGQPGVEPWLLVQGGRATTLKTRFIGHGQQLLRADREDAVPVDAKLAERLVRIARDAIAATSVTILSDYGKGVLAGDVPGTLMAAARQAGRPVVVDMRGPDFARYAGADVLTTSWRNLTRATQRQTETDATVALAAVDLRRTHDLGAVVVLRTGHSLTVVIRGDGNDAPDEVLQLRNQSIDTSDTSGLRDTVVAMLAASLAVGLPLPVAAGLANVAGSVLAGRVGTALVRQPDLLAALTPRAADHKIMSREAAAERVERWHRVGWRAGFVLGAFDNATTPEVAAMLEHARSSCDRLVVGLARDGVEPEATRAARLAALPSVDLVVSSGAEPTEELLRTLRPDLLIEAAGTAGRSARAELISEWGGRVLAASQSEPV